MNNENIVMVFNCPATIELRSSWEKDKKLDFNGGPQFTPEQPV